MSFFESLPESKDPHISKIKLRNAKKDPQLIFSELSKSSFVILSLSKTENQIIKNTWKTCYTFFQDTPTEVKQKCSIKSWRDVGYKNTPSVKQFWQMRLSDVDDFPWPESPQKFKEQMLQCYDLLDNIGRICVESIARGLQIEPNRLLEMLDHNPLPSQHFSHSLLSIYDYYPHSEDRSSCKIHKDMGLLTIVPCASVPGLQCLDYSTMKWINVERIADPNKDIIIFSGETCERLVGGYIAGSIHRVIRESELSRRYSIVFKMRLRSDSILDVMSLNSPVIGNDVPHYLKKKMTVEGFIREQLQSRESVNFPANSGFNTYANCILDPNSNRSEDYYETTKEFE